MITLSGELMDKVIRTEGTYDLTLTEWDDGDAFSWLGAGASPSPVPGSLRVCLDRTTLSVSGMGKPSDRVRIIVEGQNESRHVMGFVRQGTVWREIPVEVIQVQREISSRYASLLETDVLRGKRVFIIGAGSGGSAIIAELVSSGIMLFDLADYQRLTTGNVGRHVLGISHVGRNKARAMADFIREKNPRAEVESHVTKVDWDTAERHRPLVKRADLVICATDERVSRHVANKLCVEENRVLILAGCFRRAYGGQVLRVRPRVTPCYVDFVATCPDQAQDQEISNADQAQRIAYSDRTVAIEPGLAMDIHPVSNLVSRLTILELLPESSTIRASLQEDLTAPLFWWFNRREKETPYAQMKPLGCNINGMHILRWYGIDIPRDPACPVCGNFEGQMERKYGFKISEDEFQIDERPVAS